MPLKALIRTIRQPVSRPSEHEKRLFSLRLTDSAIKLIGLRLRKASPILAPSMVANPSGARTAFAGGTISRLTTSPGWTIVDLNDPAVVPEIQVVDEAATQVAVETVDPQVLDVPQAVDVPQARVARLVAVVQLLVKQVAMVDGLVALPFLRCIFQIT
jgi:hypothetical protein